MSTPTEGCFKAENASKKGHEFTQIHSIEEDLPEAFVINLNYSHW